MPIESSLVLSRLNLAEPVTPKTTALVVSLRLSSSKPYIIPGFLPAGFTTIMHR